MYRILKATGRQRENSFFPRKVTFSNFEKLQLKRFLRYCFEIFSRANQFKSEEKCVRDLQNNEY